MITVGLQVSIVATDRSKHVSIAATVSGVT